MADKVPTILPNDLEIARLELLFRLRRQHLLPPVANLAAGPHLSLLSGHTSWQRSDLRVLTLEEKLQETHHKSWSPSFATSWSRSDNLRDNLTRNEVGRQIDPRFVMVERDDTDSTRGRKDGLRRKMTKYYFNVTCSASISNVHHTNETREFRVASRADETEKTKKEQLLSDMVTDDRDTIYVGSSYFASKFITATY